MDGGHIARWFITLSHISTLDKNEEMNIELCALKLKLPVLQVLVSERKYIGIFMNLNL
ncbi:hypothetical protein E1A91_A08G115100v1 [Gossypium mustelinum]|uniref:Uncharacterized protein n=1 Tax=Gossypium mustelinum TaxID=34275 RepID=A0A5D2Y925_GOSMU|nr:hypothetical protein E1A91_A08G115100v1 [Gossypium mustelinum]